jgi:surface carbohydrate biosynthesis protein
MIKTISTIFISLLSLSFWKKPKVSKHLIVMPDGANELFENDIVSSKETFVLNLVNYKWLNLFIVINGLMKRRELLFKNNYLFIVLSYIEVLESQYVITWMDYQINFYRLNFINKNPIYISLQTGRRSNEPGQFFDLLRTQNYINLSCDYIFCMGEAHAEEYSKYIKCKAIPSGMVRNNMNPVGKENSIKNEILFISQFRSLTKLALEPPGGVKKPVIKNHFISFNEKVISHHTFYKAEKKLLPLLVTFCKKNSMKLNILSAATSNEIEEEIFYDSLAGKDNYTFIKHEDSNIAYKSTDKFKFIVGVNSTLCYESLARKKNRVILFDARGKYCGIPFDVFGFPMALDSKGPFWTNEVTENEFKRLMNFLIDASDDQWLESTSPIVKRLTSIDIDNSLLRRIFK